MVLTLYVKQHFLQLYSKGEISYGKIVKRLSIEGFKVSKMAVWATVKYQRERTIIIHRKERSGRPFKLTSDILTPFCRIVVICSQNTSPSSLSLLLLRSPSNNACITYYDVSNFAGYRLSANRKEFVDKR